MSSATPAESPIPEWERDLLDGRIGRRPDDGVTCDCDCKPKFGWKGKPPVPVDGDNWPLDFAAATLGISEKDLRDMVRIVDLPPAGTMKMASYRRSGRNPRVYNASKLVKIYSAVQELAQSLKDTQGK